MLICESNAQQSTPAYHDLYQQLMRATHTSIHSATPMSAPTSTLQQREQAIRFLRQQLQQASEMTSDLPCDISGLTAWSDAHVSKVGQGYQAYLQRRQAGGPREFFDNRSHALFYLQAIAPTKLVDGAWLYGLTRYWQDERFYPLIKTYIEELGEGQAQQNHVMLYTKLLERHGCVSDQIATDPLYLQGAIQLALGHYCEEFLPEIVGYNLGYEQPPLHMLITAYELQELGIDPYYFTVHITTDNASTGHARQAVDAVQRLAPAIGSTAEFYARVKAGYQLNALGPDSCALLASFDLYQQTVTMLENKRFYGLNMHSDRCRLAGKTINQWLQTSGQMDAFLNTLVKTGWVKRGADPQQSRFWQLIGAENAKMAGVFSSYEAQLIYDWIADGWSGTSVAPLPTAALLASNARAKLLDSTPSSTPAPELPHKAAGDPGFAAHQLQQELQRLPMNAKMERLIELMAPHLHSSEAGLLATRMYWKQLCR